MVNSPGESLYNTAREFFPPLQGEEKYRTQGFNEIALIYGVSELSFRKTADLINKIRYQKENGTPYRTIRDITNSEGAKIQKTLDKKSKKIIKDNGLNHEIKTKQDACDSFVQMSSELKDQELFEVVQCLPVNESSKPEILKNPVPYIHPGEGVDICLDDVGVKKQKDERKNKAQENNCDVELSTKKKRVYIQNTVVHVKHQRKSYMLNGYGVFHVLQLLLSFLIHNELNEKTLTFFIDGHGLFSKVLQYFFWHKKVIIILDWYHLRKKCSELLSMALCGSKIRNEVLNDILPLLWHGLVDETVCYLNHIQKTKVKNTKELKHLISYLRKNTPMIPAYSVRKEIGLTNSSNRGEKANELLVAHRQKKNGMSWSKSGSISLASITALSKNKEYERWFDSGEIEFKLAA